MAMISCPECGNQISTLSPNCIHCGCPINVCPKCNTVITGDVNACGHCGYKFHRIVETKTEEAVQTPPKTCTEVCLSWKERNFIYRGYWLIYYILGFLPLLPIGIATYSIVSWIERGTSNDVFAAFEALSESKDLLKEVKVLIWLMVGIIFISGNYPIYILYSAPIKLKQYALINKIDLVKSLDYTLSTDFANKSKSSFRRDGVSAYLVTKAILYQNNYDIQRKSERIFVINIVSSIISLIFLLVFLLTNIEVLMQHYLLTTEVFQLSELTAWWALILSGIIAISPSLFIKNEWQRPMMSNFVRQNLPERYYAYEKYIAPMFRYNPVAFIK